MSDLIDRRKVLNWLENYKFEFCAEVGKEREYNFVENLIKGIENEPIAYDVEQVVKELENISVQIYGEFNVLGLERAIDIVRGGGVNE